jgi:hypothetical protein
LVILLPNIGLALVLLVVVALLSNLLRRFVHRELMRVTRSEPIVWSRCSASWIVSAVVTARPQRSQRAPWA